jgi:hypothetical protein
MKKIFLNIYLQGGLGNQLFQFILGYIIAKKNKVQLRLNIERYNSYNRQFELDKFPEIHKLNISKIKNYNLFFNIYLYIHAKFCKLLKIFNLYNFINYFFPMNTEIFEESPYIYNEDLLKKKIDKNITITGYFQSEKYFTSYRKHVLKLFRFPKIKDELIMSFLYLIKNNNSVAVHIRRGDYLSNPKARYFHGILGQDYYKKSITYIRKKLKKPSFFIFSDDIHLVKKTFPFFNNKNYTFINTNSAMNDLYLMKNCKHFIIANSTFSWWGAWLSTNKSKIICSPKKWSRSKSAQTDIIPKSWIRI